MQLKGNFERVWFYLELGFVVLNLVLSETWFCRLELGTKESDPPFALQLLGRTSLETKAPSSPSSLSEKEIKEFFLIINFRKRNKRNFEVEVQARFLSSSLVSILPLIFCRGYEVESWSRF